MGTSIIWFDYYRINIHILLANFSVLKLNFSDTIKIRYFLSVGEKIKTGRPLDVNMIVGMTFASGIPTGLYRQPIPTQVYMKKRKNKFVLRYALENKFKLSNQY